MNKFEEVGNILNEWATRVKGARGTAIADVTIDTIESIYECFNLPITFIGYIREYRTREGALQSIADYRDHFIHPFHVFCLGYVILNQWRKNRRENVIFKLIREDYLLSWDEIPGKDSVKFIEFLRQNYGVNWAKTRDIIKTNSDSIINISSGDKSLSFRLTNKKSKAILEIDDKKIDEFIVKRENNELKIYANENILLKKWFVTSIYHDVGYPSEKFEILVKDFFKTGIGREVKSHFDWSSVLLANENIKHIREISELFNKKTKNKYGINFEKWFYKRLVEDHDHGILTALILLSDKYLFSWNEIPGKDSVKFIEFLRQNYGINWVRTEDIIKKSDNLINISFGDNLLSFGLDNEKSKAILKIDSEKTEFSVKKENNKLNIYGKIWQNEDRTIAHEAALAIAIHNWKRPMNPDSTYDLDQLKAIDLPLAFFLTYCDYAQEWGRRVLLELLSKDRTIEILNEIPKLDSILEDVTPRENGASVTIRYLLSKWSDPVSETKNLDTVFKDVGKNFWLTWLIDRKNLEFIIYGKDIGGTKNPSTIGPQIRVN